MHDAYGGRIRERVRELQRSLARLERRRREALARDDVRTVAWAEDLIIRVEELLGRIATRDPAAIPHDNDSTLDALPPAPRT